MIVGRITAKKQQAEQRKAQTTSYLSDPLGVNKMIQGATAINLQNEREKKFGSMESVLTPPQQKTVGRIAAATERITGSEYLGSLVSRGAAPLKVIGQVAGEAMKSQAEKPREQAMKELPEITRKVGLAFVEGFNTAMLRFVKSGSEALIGREKTEQIGALPGISDFTQDVTGKGPEEKILTFQKIAENVHADAIANGATEEGARQVTTFAVMGAMFAESPFWPGKGVSKNAATFIAKSNDAAAIRTRLVKEFPDFLNKATPEQLDIMSTMLVNIKRPEDVQSILNRTGFALHGRITAKEGQPPAVRQRLRELSRQPETQPTLPSPTATVAKTPEIPPKTPDAVGEGSGLDLVTEAKKYKSPEEFIDAQTKDISAKASAESPVFKKYDYERTSLPIESIKEFETVDLKSSKFQEIKRSVSRGDRTPIVVDERNRIIDGHHRFNAYKESGANYGSVPVLKAIGGGTGRIIRDGDYFDPKIKGNLTDIWNQANESDSFNRIISESAKDTRATAAAQVDPRVGDTVPPTGITDSVEGIPATTAKTEKPAPKIDKKLVERAQQSKTYQQFEKTSGVTKEALDTTVQKQGYKDAKDFYEQNKLTDTTPVTPPRTALTEEQSLELTATQQAGSEYVLSASAREEDKMTSALESVFADLKGVDLKDIKTKYTEKDLDLAQMQYEFAMESLMDDPARALVKYVSRSTGRLPEVTGTEFIKSPNNQTKQIRNSKFGKDGDKILQEIFGYEAQITAREAQDKLDNYLLRKEEMTNYLENLNKIKVSIRLSKQKDAFVGKEKKRLATEFANNQKALNNIVRAAERAGFRRGQESSANKYTELITRLKTRRKKLDSIKRLYNLSDQDMKRAMGSKDPRFMIKEEYDRWVTGVEFAAVSINKRNQARALAESLVAQKDLKKTENLQKAMSLPTLKNMKYSQLLTFIQVLNRTEAGDTFLGPRMIQTVKNTDLGNVKTVGEARKKIEATTGLKADPVEGRDLDNWLRDPTLVERDALHNLYITEWAGKEAEMLTRKYHFRTEIDTLAKSARKSRRILNNKLRKEGKIKQSVRDRVLSRLAPQDRLVTEWLQPFRVEFDQAGKRQVIRDDSIREKAEAAMTKEELVYAKHLRDFFNKYYAIAADEANARWSLMGVKHSNYRDIYFTHMPRGFFERWKDDGFLSAAKTFWSRNMNDANVIDFNAYGDKGEVLGLEKWLNQNSTRQFEGVDKKGKVELLDKKKYLYTQNTSEVAMAYFHAFERKMLLDSMIPKIKLYEFLLGARKQTPKSASNPEGTEQIHSKLRDHINRWINNKKGQKSWAYIEQGSRVESVVDGLRLWVAAQHLGVNVIAQTISGLGGEVATYSGLGIKGWTTGHRRALTKQGRRLGYENPGVIGEPPWNELASAANNAGDTLRSGIFYLFGDLSFRARRQMFLGLLTPQEFRTGVITSKRLGEIKLQIGKWHSMPEFRSIRGSTTEIKAAAMYTEWAVPIIQTTYTVNLPRVINMLKKASGPKEMAAVMKTKEFQELFRVVVAGVGVSALAYMVLQPDDTDHSNAGYLRRKAAQELSSAIEAITFRGLPMPGAILMGYLEQMYDALWALLTQDKYTSAGPGYKEGDLRGTRMLYKTLVPSGIRRTRVMIFGEPETPTKTKADLNKEVLQKIESGEMTIAAAKVYYEKQLTNIKNAEKRKRFEMDEAAYKKDLLKRLEAKEITVEDGKKEFIEYQKEQAKYSPEKFESNNDADFIKKIQIAAKAIGTDPVTLFKAIFTSEEIRRMDNGKIILHRGKSSDPQKQRDWAIEKRKEFGANADLILDHRVPLTIGGDNSDKNLRLVPKADWESWTPVETYLGRELRNGNVTASEARKLILDFKDGKITAEEVYSALDSR